MKELEYFIALNWVLLKRDYDINPLFSGLGGEKKAPKGLDQNSLGNLVG